MFPNISPVETLAWKKLQADQQFMKGIQMKSLFTEDRERFQCCSIIFGDILFDYSKNLLNEETFAHLLDLAAECKVWEAQQAMFAGEKINHTENRSVLHTALRNFSGEPVYSDGKDVMPEVQKVQKQMKDFCAKKAGLIPITLCILRMQRYTSLIYLMRLYYINQYPGQAKPQNISRKLILIYLHHYDLMHQYKQLLLYQDYDNTLQQYSHDVIIVQQLLNQYQNLHQ